MPCLIKLRIEMRGTQKIYTRKMSRQIQHENKRILVSFNWIKICMTFKQIKIEAQKKFYIEEFFSFRAAWMRMGNFQIGQIVNQNCKPYHNCYLHAQPLTIRVFFFWCTFFFIEFNGCIAAAKLENADADTCRCCCFIVVRKKIFI